LLASCSPQRTTLGPSFATLPNFSVLRLDITPSRTASSSAAASSALSSYVDACLHIEKPMS